MYKAAYIFVVLFLIFLYVPTAHASVIISRTLYSGLTQGLVGHWTFDGADMAGTAVYDKSGNGNRGILTNSPGLIEGRIGQAINFDGATDAYLSAGTGASVADLGPMTLSVWMKPRSEGKASGGVVAWKSGGGANAGWRFDFDSGASRVNALRWRVDYTTDLTREINDNQITLNTWQHVLLTWDGSTTAANVHIYIDGVEATYLTTTDATGSRTSDSASDLKIGRGDLGGAPQNFDGLIDDVRMYNRVLSADEIKRLYKMGGTLTVNQTTKTEALTRGLVGHWTFDGGDMAGVVAYDRSGNNDRGILTSSPVRVEGKIGQALQFDGTNANVQIADPASGVLDFASTSDFSVSGWFKRAAPSTQRSLVSKKASGSTGYDVSSAGSAGSNKVIAAVSDGTNTATLTGSTNLSTLNVWNHFVFVWAKNSSGQAILYVNGVDDNAALTGAAVASVGDVSNAQILRIGDTSTGSSSKFLGLLDDIRVYNRALSADEVKRLYKMGGTLTINKTVTNSSLINGLVGHWTFDGADMARTAAFDKSGNGNRGILANGPVLIEGKIGQGLKFNGDDSTAPSSVDAGNASILNNLSSFSISAWLYAPTGIKGRILDKNQTSGNIDPISGWYFSIDSNSAIRFAVEFGLQVLKRISSTNILNLNTWNNVLLTWDGSSSATNVHIFVNGIEASYTTTQDASGSRTSDSASNLAIGANIPDQSSGFNGSLDDVRIYNRVLSADEIKRLYIMGK